MGDSRVGDGFRQFIRLHRADLVALAALCLCAGAFLSPSIVDGGTFGTFDFNTTLSSLGDGLYPQIHNHSNGDAVQQMISWNALDWRAIHSGHFPLWNDYSGLGMPEFLNFESSVLSLPDLVSYLVPIENAFLVVVFVKLALAGTGAYVFARVIGLRVPSALFAGVTFMFSGAFANWVTWPLSDVVAWSGWIAAFLLLSYRSRRLGWIVGLAVSVAFSVFGGFPEANVMMALVVGAFFAAAALAAWFLRRPPSLAGLGCVAIGLLAGVVLSSPLWFPGLELLPGSHRQGSGGYAGLPIKSLPLLFSQGYLGEPFAGPTHYGLLRWNYYETVAYVGVPALALALVGLFGARRKPIVIGLGFAVLVAFAASYQPIGLAPFFRIVNHIDGLSAIRFERTKAVGGFAVAILAAVGFDRCWSLVADRKWLRRQWAGFGVIAIVVGAVVVQTVRISPVDPRFTPHSRALIAPTVLVGLLFAVAIAVAVARRKSTEVALRVRRVGMVAILVGQAAFVFIAGVGIPSYSHAFYPETPAISRLKAIVGNGLVGLDGGNTTEVRRFKQIGFFPEVNVGYQLRVFAIHDPLLPSAYLTTWPEPVTDAGPGGVGMFVPDVSSAALARRYGIGFILSAPGRPVPPGAEKVAVLAGQTLYRVPGAARFSFAGQTANRVQSVTGSAATSFTIRTGGPTSGTLVMRVTAVPGWHCTIDGRPADLATFDGVMQSVKVPAGAHVVTLRYLPDRLVVGTAAATFTVLAFAGAALIPVIRRRRQAARTAAGVGAGRNLDDRPVDAGPTEPTRE
jgi:hypothetical protein